MSQDYSKYLVLAVDDIPLNLLLIKKMLAKFNFRLVTASDGQSALDMIAAEKPDLILLDLMLPGVDGFDVLKTVRENPATADIKVVILSALNSNDDIVKGFKLGADDFLAKPIIMEKLVDCVLKQLEAVGEK
ncbi:MAG: response regulator [Bacteroidales bacterium]|nr:response regulator [Bacteroidales bacterium]MDO4213398.1 response regulator [Bacteroidales bacterium]